MHPCVKDVHAGRQALHLHPLPHHVLGTAVPVILIVVYKGVQQDGGVVVMCSCIVKKVTLIPGSTN
jgi:hypothetical protein